MPGVKSPYAEIGLSVYGMTRRTGLEPRKKVKLVGVSAAGSPRDGHEFNPFGATQSRVPKHMPKSLPSTRRHVDNANTVCCRRCGKPKFAVEGTRCKGRRK